MSVIDALKRLERAGLEDSKTTQKLKAAARALSDYVISQLNQEVINECNAARADLEGRHVILLPQSYVIDFDSNGKVLAYLYCNGDTKTVDADREAALRFGRIVAEGWLEQVALWLAKRAHEAAELSARMEAEYTVVNEKMLSE